MDILLHSLTLMEFSEIIRKIVSDEMVKISCSMSEYIVENSMPELLTRKETAEMIGVSLPTLRSYVTKGYLTAHKVGNKTVRFRKEEVIGALNVSNKKKHSVDKNAPTKKSGYSKYLQRTPKPTKQRLLRW